jgi:hypothetical protein
MSYRLGSTVPGIALFICVCNKLSRRSTTFTAAKVAEVALTGRRLETVEVVIEFDVWQLQLFTRLHFLENIVPAVFVSPRQCSLMQTLRW